MRQVDCVLCGFHLRVEAERVLRTLVCCMWGDRCFGYRALTARFEDSLSLFLSSVFSFCSVIVR